MGTSSSGSGGGKSNPLIPSWIGGGGLPPAPLPDKPNDNDGDPQNDDSTTNPDIENPNNEPFNPEQIPNQPTESNNRYIAPRRRFNRYARSGRTNVEAAKQALRTYSRTAAGSTTNLAKRMRPSAGRVANFFDAIQSIRTNGVTTALSEFNLIQLQNRPALVVLSAIGEYIFRDFNSAYENTQDDSITKAAYANTVTRICEQDPNLDLNQLTNEQIDVMMAIFIEETIAQRVINDIGNQFTELSTDINELLEIENSLYQIISGLVRTQIMPEITATRQSSRNNLEKNIENIYRIAFDVIGGINN